MKIDLDALQALAEAATAGPWDWDHECMPAHIAGGEIVDEEALPYGPVYTAYEVQFDPEDPDWAEPLIIAEKVRDKDARFMRAANPQTILALIDMARRAQADPAIKQSLVTKMTDKQIDTYLDRILRAAGTALGYYSLQKTKDDMREAMRDALAQETK